MNGSILPSDPSEQLIPRLASLSDPARLRILHLLEHQPMLVNDLADVLQLPQSTVSRHLKQLSDQGWLVSRREGTSHQYQMLLREIDAGARSLWTLARDQSAEWSAVAQDKLRLASVLAARQRDSRTFFAGAARDWDRLRGEYFGNRFSFDAMLALLDPKLTVADLGCGTGAIVADLAPHVAKVIGIDNSEQMLHAARQRIAGLSHVELRHGDLAALPLDDASVDAALCVLSLSYAADIALALKEARRTLRPRGRLIVVDVLTHDRDDFRRQMGQVRMGFAEADLTATLRAAGFTTVRFRNLSPESQVKGPALFLAIAS
jgi:ArsR family transcriptional regulator